jgi:hypothetical protein
MVMVTVVAGTTAKLPKEKCYVLTLIANGMVWHGARGSGMGRRGRDAMASEMMTMKEQSENTHCNRQPTTTSLIGLGI